MTNHFLNYILNAKIRRIYYLSKKNVTNYYVSGFDTDILFKHNSMIMSNIIKGCLTGVETGFFKYRKQGTAFEHYAYMLLQ